MVHRPSVDSLFEVPPEILDAVRRQTDEEEGRLAHLEPLLDAWIRSEPHLPDNYDRRMARNFLRGAKFGLEAAKRKMEGYFLAKHAFPEFYRDREPAAAEIARMFDCVNIVRLPRFTERGERIIYMSLQDPDPDQLDIVAAIKLFWMLYDLTLTGEYPITAEIIIFDCTNFTSAHLAQFISTSIKHCIRIFRDAYAARISQIHFANTPNSVEKVVSTFRPLVPDKIKKRLFIHKGTETLLKHLSAKVLPTDIGGNLESCRDYMKIWKEFMIENTDWFREQEEVKILGTPPKRIEKFSRELSLEGSFRQLNID